MGKKVKEIYTPSKKSMRFVGEDKLRFKTSLLYSLLLFFPIILIFFILH